MYTAGGVHGHPILCLKTSEVIMRKAPVLHFPLYIFFSAIF
ncbi:hypothetical protein GDO81_014655 [Engystomops pustulosus]|uniref:Uncharacterized protein n=1 Tax=Engystomops pustulosus TaxID=76066 RepID=A0AAV7BC05_ENGPU|nr:hypothetical protein GDO81_014655 [Engystomops pustulosus]